MLYMYRSDYFEKRDAMNYQFADRMVTLKPSAIREILKQTAQPGIISFAAGNPAVSTFPTKEMADISAELFADPEKIGRALQYGVSEGYQPLKDVTLARMKSKYATGRENDDVIITSGGQQVMDLITKAFVNKGDTIIVEAPSFIGSLNSFRTYEPNLVAVPMQVDGMDIEVLEEKLRSEKNVKFIYCIPTFQNPTGYTTSLEKRKAIYALAQKYDVLIVEDNPYFELRFAGSYVPTLKSLDTDGRVVYAGSYSKILSSGIRLGYIIADKAILAKIAIGKQATDVHTNLFFQTVAAEYLSRYDLDAHIERARAIYDVKRRKMLDCLAAKMPEGVTYSNPDGGLFLWLDLPEGYDGKVLAAMCIERKLAIVPGCSFMLDDTIPCRGVRLNYSMPSEEQIEEGTTILAVCVKQYLGK